MKLKYLNFLSYILLMFALTLTFSCNEDNTIPYEPQQSTDDSTSDDADADEDVDVENPEYTYPESVSIDTFTGEYTIDDEGSDYYGMRAIDILRGETIQLEYTYSPDEIDVDKWNWVSSDSDVANVDMYGTVIATTSGESVIKVYYTGSSRIVADSILLVSDIVTIQAITISTSQAIEYEGVTYDTQTIIAGKTLQLNATMTPEGSSYTSVDWESSNPTIASIDSGGVVTGNIGGTGQIVTFTATAQDGSGVTGTFDLLVVQYDTVITIDEIDNFIFPLNEGSAQFTASGATGDIYWMSSDESVAKFEDAASGKLSFYTLGETEITAFHKESGKHTSTTIKIPGGYYRELFREYDADYATNCLWYVGYTHIWYAADAEGDEIGDGTTGGYVHNVSNSSNLSRMDLASNETLLSYNLNYPYIVIHMDDPSSMGLAGSSPTTIKTFYVEGMAAATDMTRSAVYSTNANPGISKLFVWDITNYVGTALDGLGEYEVVASASGASYFLRIDTTSSACENGVTYFNLYSVQSFATESDMNAYIAKYNN